MKTLLINLTTVRKELLLILILSLGGYFLIELYLSHIPELYKGGYEIGQFFLKCSQSYISAFIFYFFVVHIKNEKDKKNVNEFVSQKVASIITRSNLFFETLYDRKKSKIDLEDRSELHYVLKSVNRHDQGAPFQLNNRKGTWMEWWEYLKQGIEDDLKQIFIRLPYLDTELIKQLTRIENSLFMTQWNMLYEIEHETTFSIYEFNVLTYRNLLTKLKRYSDKKFQGMGDRDGEFVGTKDEYLH